MTARQTGFSDLQSELPLAAASVASRPSQTSRPAPTGLLDLRSRLRRRGSDALDDCELLVLLLARLVPDRNSASLARILTERFGSLPAILATPPRDLGRACGLPEDALEDLGLIEAMSHRLARAQVMDRDVISSWDALVRYCRIVMAHRTVEGLRLLYLDRKNVLIADELQQTGTIDHVPVYPREVVRRALELNAAALILVHNHPSGDPTPSASDIEMTRKVQAGLETVGISLHDHIVIGREAETSFRSAGLL